MFTGDTEDTASSALGPGPGAGVEDADGSAVTDSMPEPPTSRVCCLGCDEP